MPVDASHDPQRRSFVASANGHADFPIQNLPLGVFSTSANPIPRIGIAIGDAVVDLALLANAGLTEGLPATETSLNAFMGLGGDARRR
ncbi:MAG: fumarylacetoacetase, partial [Acidimicrobiia bacterium]